MQPQLSLVSERARRVGISSLFIGLGLSACGEAATPVEPRGSTLLIAERSQGWGAVFGAGGEVGVAEVWVSRPDGQRGLTHCEVALESADDTPRCTESCSGEDCPRAVERGVHLLDFDEPDVHCYAVGRDGDGLRLDCDGETNRLAVPDAVITHDDWRLATDTGVAPLLLAASPAAQRAWFYAPSIEGPIEIDIGAERVPAGFGTDVAALRLGPDRFNSRIIAVSAPAEGQVWLMRGGFPLIDQPFRVGCLGERRDFGRTMASGDIDGDGLTDLVVADRRFVTAFSGVALAMVSSEQQPHVCSLASLPDSAILASVSCASGGSTSGCEDADFGASITVADLDGDTDGEIIVGAPGMSVLGEQAGAVLVYDAEGMEPNAMTESIVETSSSAGARFGASLGVVQGKNVDALVVGAPGRGSIFLAACFSLTRPELRPKICGGS